MKHQRPPMEMRACPRATRLLVVALLLGTTTRPSRFFTAATTTELCPEQPGMEGARRGYHAPGPSDVYLPSCRNVLRRELWRVFRKDTGLAYMIPRPDAELGRKYHLCDEASSEAQQRLAASARKYGLCDETVTEPSIVNNMDPFEALAIADALHQRLEFRILQGRIDPWVPDMDLLDACDLLLRSTTTTSQTEADAESYCQSLAERSYSLVDHMAYEPSGASLSALLPALNELYGVVPIGAACPSESWGSGDACPVAKCAPAPEGCRYKLDNYAVTDDRECCPKLCYAVDNQGNDCSNVSSAAPKAEGYFGRIIGSSVALSWLLLFGGTLVPG